MITTYYQETPPRPKNQIFDHSWPFLNLSKKNPRSLPPHVNLSCFLLWWNSIVQNLRFKKGSALQVFFLSRPTRKTSRGVLFFCLLYARACASNGPKLKILIQTYAWISGACARLADKHAVSVYCKYPNDCTYNLGGSYNIPVIHYFTLLITFFYDPTFLSPFFSHRIFNFCKPIFDYIYWWILLIFTC